LLDGWIFFRIFNFIFLNLLKISKKLGLGMDFFKFQLLLPNLLTKNS